MGRSKKYKTEEERKAARKERQKRWYQENREERLDYQKQYHQANSDKVKERQKHWREKNPNYQKRWREKNAEKVKESNKRWREKNPEKYSDYQKRWYQENRDKVIEHQKEYSKTPIGRASNLVSAYQWADKKYNRGECTLTAEWIMDNIFNKPCHYCGKEGWNVVGCDRIDNSLPHSPDNVVPCCDECNTKRGRKTYEEFMNTIRTNAIIL